MGLLTRLQQLPPPVRCARCFQPIPDAPVPFLGPGLPYHPDCRALVAREHPPKPRR